jgi:hypothetical protein
MHLKSKDINNNYQSIKELADAFFELENKYNLIDLEISGVKVWQCIRCKLFTSMAAKLFNLGIAHESEGSTLRLLISMVFNGVRHSALFEREHDVIVFPHQRVRLVEGEYIDINTHYFVKDLISQHRDVLVLERPYRKKHLKKPNKHTRYIDDSIIFTHLFKKLFRPKLKSSKKIINVLSNEIENNFNIIIDLHGVFKEAIQKFKASYIFYIFLLKRIKPRQIYLVISYAYPSLVKAAKDRAIEVVEIQHGAFSKYHLGYSYNSIRKVDYFPDKFLAWNDYWRNMRALPLLKKDIGIYPFKYQETEFKKYENISKVSNQVVILSQGPIANQMSKIILENFDFFEDKIVKYKLHPGELKSYKEYKYLKKLLDKENVELVTDDILYELLASSEYQVGVYSTALYEGIQFGLKTILCNTMFVEYMEELIASGQVYLILNAKK